jgi:serine/threonine-protein kinase
MTAIPAKQQKVPRDLHELVGQVIDERFRVKRLAYVSPRQWLYEVEPPSVGHTRRALKLIALLEARESNIAQKLLHLTNTLREIKSPCIEEMFDLGWLADETPYLIVQWHPQPSLYEYVRRHSAMSWEKAKPILLDIAKGLSALHDKGIVHGDVRSQHVLLKDSTDITGSALLIDCGLQTVLDGAPIIGLEHSLAYWAPEVALGYGSVSFESDLYGFAVIAYFCLMGKLPFIPSVQPQKPQDPAVLLKEMHLSASPPEITADCPQSFKDLYLMLMSKDPHQRLSHAKDVVSLLEDIDQVQLKVNPFSPPQWQSTPTPNLPKIQTKIPTPLPKELTHPNTLPKVQAFAQQLAEQAHLDRELWIEAYQRKQKEKLIYVLIATVALMVVVILANALHLI